MANREALRQLHARLAARLHAARSEGVTTARWLAVEAGASRYLMPLVHAGEIFPWSGVLRVPYTRPWLLGVANLRGTLAAVVDFSGLLGQSTARSEMALAGASLLAFNPMLEVHAALLVDRLLGLRGAQDFTGMQDAPADAPAWRGATYFDAAGDSWQEIDLRLLSHDPDFLHIRA
ncbi:MAG: chemotaxis protein CheW [Comamonas sp.]